MPTTTKALTSVSTGVACAYTVFIVIGFLISYAISGGEISGVLVMGACAQCLGIVFLCIQVSSSRVATGISTKAIALDAVSIVCRLSNTLWLNAYIPQDPTGDALYQGIEILSLLSIMWLLHKVLVTYRDTYQATEDTFNLVSVVAVCFVLGAIFHIDMADRPFFDALWMTGLFSGTLAVLPQLLLICKTGGRVQALTSHYIIALALSRVLNGIIMWLARGELECEPWIGGINHGKWAVLTAHAVQILLVADFAYHYVQSAILHGFRGTLELPTAMSSDDGNKARWV